MILEIKNNHAEIEKDNIKKESLNSKNGFVEKPIFKNITGKKTGRTVSEEQHLANKSKEIIRIYGILKEVILHADSNIVVDSKVEYIAFKRNKKNLFDLKILESKVIMWVNKKKGELPKNIADLFQDCSEKGHHGNGDYEIHFENIQQLNDFMSTKAIINIINQ
ncbi:MAG: hypothetical protein HC854_07775 [Flavobacterium sp.]|nr:hypothetical protein [Flavobacterium sp.]